MERETDRHKAKFNSFTDRQVKILQKKILDLSELVVPIETFPAFRSKVLGATNDMLRELKSEMERNYQLKFSPEVIREDIVVVTPPSKRGTSTVRLTKEDDNSSEG